MPKFGFHSAKTLLSFTTGLMRSPKDVFNLTDRTIPSVPGKTWITLAKGQRPRGVKSSRIHTKSSTCKFFDVLCHLQRTCWVGKYSRRKRFQKWVAICCDERQLFERFFSLPMKTQGDKLTDERPQSETNLLGFPLRLTKRLMQLIVESVVRSFETSRCTALTTRQVKSKIYRLDNLPLFLTGKGPMKSRPVVSKTNGFFLGNMSSGKSAIWGC